MPEKVPVNGREQSLSTITKPYFDRDSPCQHRESRCQQEVNATSTGTVPFK